MSTDIISEEKLEAALRYLAMTDDAYAIAKANLERSEILRKRVRARIFLGASGTVAERQAIAEGDSESAGSDDAYIEALGTAEMLKAKRQRAEIVIDVWRSLNASKRRS